jgi:hypothetical protein
MALGRWSHHRLRHGRRRGLGFVPSACQAGRDILVDMALVERGAAFQWLTRNGVEVALCGDWSIWSDQRAHKKATE